MRKARNRSRSIDGRREPQLRGNVATEARRGEDESQRSFQAPEGQDLRSTHDANLGRSGRPSRAENAAEPSIRPLDVLTRWRGFCNLYVPARPR